MSVKVDGDSYPLNWLRWLLVVAIVSGGIVANSIYSDVPLIYRAIALLVLGVLALWIAIYTDQGSSVWVVVKESLTEVRKVVWPTRQEANQTTLIVVVLVVITAFILWGLDTFFGWIASLIIG
ncbi:MAG: preprotein translocase subunit SecE [Cellvibrionaceae bacterium]|nr:preprotein translocase subunit SecE [Cellvibrionaceae bacterium]